MANKSGVSDQIISLPKGGGELKGLGEKFQPDLHKGTGNFTFPIDVPPGRNGFQPQLDLSYSTGAPNGPFGIGWTLSISKIFRKTSKGIPKYKNEDEASSAENEDTFVLSGEEDLIHLGNGLYRPKSEQLFARIRKLKSVNGNSYWKMETKDGKTSFYGVTENSRVYPNEDKAKIYEWLCDKIVDNYGNEIIFKYKHDCDPKSQSSNFAKGSPENNHQYNQIYLESIQYTNFRLPQDPANNEFLWKIDFDYGEFDEDGKQVKNWEIRPDCFSNYKSGFEIRTTRLCKRVFIQRLLQAGKYELVKCYELKYDQDPFTNISVLTQVELKGYKDGKIQVFPPLQFGYTKFEPENSRIEVFENKNEKDLPEMSLSDPNYEIVDLFGDGLPCVVESSQRIVEGLLNGWWRYWQNLGNLTFAEWKEMEKGAPRDALLRHEGVQFADMNGDGSVELLVTVGDVQGYFLKDNIRASWTNLKRFSEAPEFSLEAPGVKLVDLDGDGVVDILDTRHHQDGYYSFYRNMNAGDKLSFARSEKILLKKNSDEGPNLGFADPLGRVRLADISGDGMQDIVLLSLNPPLTVSYWANLGYGNFGKRINMAGQIKLPQNFNLNRLFLADLNGDGLADILYDDNGSLHFWINQSGNGWSQENIIRNTPRVRDPRSIRVADMKGNGNSGILWTYSYNENVSERFKYLDLTNGTKPLLLKLMDNNMGATTEVAYRSCIMDYLNDKIIYKNPHPWKSTPPFPLQVVSKVEINDYFSEGKVTTEYTYHHGYWDGNERDFIGFGRVDQYDTEHLQKHTSKGLYGHKEFKNLETESYSPPTKTVTWFHQGAVTSYDNKLIEMDFTDEFWQEDVRILSFPSSMNNIKDITDEKVKRGALRSLKNRILRTELYSLDATELENRPYVITEYLHEAMNLTQDGIKFNNAARDQDSIFFPCTLAERKTNWGRGNEPMTQYKFVTKYDHYGQPTSEIAISVPRNQIVTREPFFVVLTKTSFAYRDDELKYIVDRVASITSYEIINDGNMSVFNIRELIERNQSSVRSKIMSQTLNYYDGPSFQGLSFGKIGEYGALVRSERLALTNEILDRIILEYPSCSGYLSYFREKEDWSSEYPKSFQRSLPAKQFPVDPTRPGLVANQLGYGFSNGENEYAKGYFVATERRAYDFNEDPASAKGLVRVYRDAVGNDRQVEYDSYDLLVTKSIDALGLMTRLSYDYRVQQPTEVVDPNYNLIQYAYTPLGLLQSIAYKKVDDVSVGDNIRPSIQFTYNLNAFLENSKQPPYVCTIQFVHHDTEKGVKPDEMEENLKKYEYSDGFGRLLQTRTSGDQVLANDKESLKISIPEIRARLPEVEPVVVSGWQKYDDKGRIVEKYEPFLSKGWFYESYSTTQPENSTKIVMQYDPIGNLINTVYPDGAEQSILFGRLQDTEVVSNKNIIPSPWEIYTFDPNDNAIYTHPISPEQYRTHSNTPSNIVLDALSRKIKTVERNGIKSNKWIISYFEYDSRGNLVNVTNNEQEIVFNCVYDLSENPRKLIIKRLDGGIQVKLFDANGNVIEERDSKGAAILHESDIINRPTRIWARDKYNESVTLREHIIYGDNVVESNLTRAKAAKLNLLGRIYKHYDESGVVSFVPSTTDGESQPYDFKGNILEKTRQVISDESILHSFKDHTQAWDFSPFRVNWELEEEDDVLDSTVYRISYRYDALNRVNKVIYPPVGNKAKIESILYNSAGLLQSIKVDNTSVIKLIAYNAKGQRTLIAYGNGIMSRFWYDNNNFRLLRMRTEKYKESELYLMPTGPALQEVEYLYDFVGNIIAIKDKTVNSTVRRNGNSTINKDKEYVYDALYRLVSATGWEQSTDFHKRTELWCDTVFVNDIKLTRNYVEEYQYDGLGNLTKLSHHTRDQNSAFVRDFEKKSNGNALHKLSSGAVTYIYEYDQCGNLIKETSSRIFEWDYSNRMRSSKIQLPGKEPSMYTLYLYDSHGKRVKKFERKQGGHNTESTVYIDDIFEQHSVVKGDKPITRFTLHLLDIEKKFASIYFTKETGDTNSNLHYYLQDHLGNNNLMLDEGGVIINIEEYTPYGETSFGSFDNKKYRFLGKERDSETGIYYCGARYYLPYLARWNALDPLGADDAISPYVYCRDNPIRLVDSDGKQSKDWSIPLTASAESAARTYADLVVEGQKQGGFTGTVKRVAGWTGGLFASLWTEETATTTAITLGTAGLGVYASAGMFGAKIQAGAALLGSLSTGISAGEAVTGTSITGEQLTTFERIVRGGNAALGIWGLTRGYIRQTRLSEPPVSQPKMNKMREHTFMTKERGIRLANGTVDPNSRQPSLLSEKYADPATWQDIHSKAVSEAVMNKPLDLLFSKPDTNLRVRLMMPEQAGWSNAQPTHQLTVPFSKGGWHMWPSNR